MLGAQIVLELRLHLLGGYVLRTRVEWSLVCSMSGELAGVESLLHYHCLDVDEPAVGWRQAREQVANTGACAGAWSRRSRTWGAKCRRC